MSFISNEVHLDTMEKTRDNSPSNNLTNEIVCLGMISPICVHLKHPQEIVEWDPIDLSEPNILRKLGTGIEIGTISADIAGILLSMNENNQVEIQGFCERSQDLVGSDQFVFNAILYCNAELCDVVGPFLSDLEVFLQDPCNCDRDVQYLNPHLLPQRDGKILSTFTLSEETEKRDDKRIVPEDEDLVMELFQPDRDIKETSGNSLLATDLYSHQKQALTFMLEREMGWSFSGLRDDIWKVEEEITGSKLYINTITGNQQRYPPPDFYGGLLADQMGLGKTLSMIALITSNTARISRKRKMSTRPQVQEIKATLIVVPLSIINTWEAQLHSHLNPGALTWKRFHGQTKPSLAGLKECDVVITTYQTLVQEWKSHQRFGLSAESLFSLHWHRVVLDEAHLIQNRTTTWAKACRDLESRNRWAMTGTPIQNRLTDLASILEFLRVHPFSDPKFFDAEISVPWQKSSADGLRRLKSLLKAIALYRLKSIIKLPKKFDEIRYLEFSPEERQLYESTKLKTKQVLHETAQDICQPGAYLNCLQWLNKLRLICNHGTMRQGEELGELNNVGAQIPSSPATAQATFDRMVAVGLAPCSLCSENIADVVDVIQAEESSYPPRLSECMELVCGKCVFKNSTSKRTPGCQHIPTCPIFEVTLSSGRQGFSSVLTALGDHNGRSTKVNALLKELQNSKWGEKSVVFSYWTTTLDLIESTLRSESITYTRIDGRISAEKRAQEVRKFQTDGDIQVMLVSITCGGAGLDLTAACRAYLMEPQWNPMIEEQAMSRIYRMGQKRNVKLVRFRIRDSFEEKVVLIQDKKKDLVNLAFGSERSGEGDTVTILQQLCETLN